MRLGKIRIPLDRRTYVIIGVSLVAASIIGQLLYGHDRMAPFTTIHSVQVGGWKAQDVAREMNQRAKKQEVAITLKATGKPYKKVQAQAMGVVADYTKVAEAAVYPLWARLVPTSMLWYGLTQNGSDPAYSINASAQKKFIVQQLGDCSLKPVDATLKAEGGELIVAEAVSGGTCDKAKVTQQLASAQPIISMPFSVALDVAVVAPDVDDKTAVTLKKDIESRIQSGISVKVLDRNELIAKKDVVSMLEFLVVNKKLTASISQKSFDEYITPTIAKTVQVTPTTTKVVTRDFTEVSRKDGAVGRTLNGEATKASLLAVVNGAERSATAVTQEQKSPISYERTYSNSTTGISAMLQHFDEDNPGVFGVHFSELNGGQVAHNQSRQFVTASTYKLFVAFSTLKRVESGEYKWSDQITGGRTLEKCFSDMISLSDNPCAETLINKITRKSLNEDLRSIGLGSTSFIGGNNTTTAADLGLFLTKLETGKLPLNDDSRSRLLGAMKGNIYRQGVTTGASGTVANKVGFLWALLHDAAIVYSPKGTYVLVVLSDGSSWAKIAELTRKIEALR